MGAFFLYKNEVDINLPEVRKVFEKKGFKEPRVFKLNGMTLWLYQKQLVDDKNYIIMEDGSAIFATGTVIYKGLSYRDSLKALITDYLNNQLNLEDILGNFGIIFYVQNKIRILTDRKCIHRLFIDKDRTRLSTSFLAMLASFNSPQSINQMAFYEKICTGYVVAPDTLISSIQQITPQIQQEFKDDKFNFISYPKPPKVVMFRDSFETCIEQQLAGLKDYMSKVKPLCKEYGAVLGLSGGYDSRLLFLLCLDAGIPVSVYTHLTEGVHESEYRIAKLIVESKNMNLHTIRTKRLEEHTEDEIARILTENLYYFDGRNARSVGVFSDVNTRTYKMGVLRDNRVSLNGKGGEIYRNFSFTAAEKFQFLQWIYHHIYYPLIGTGKEDKWSQPEVDLFILRKIGSRLGINVTNKIDLFTLRLFYGEIYLSDCEGNANNAHNQLSFHITPFMEYPIVQNSYRVGKYIGKSGEFESRMMVKLDAALATITSRYGFSFSWKEPLSYKIYALIKGFLPDKYWVRYHNYRTLKGNYGKSLDEYLEMCTRSKIIREIDGALHDYFPQVNWHYHMLNRDFRNNAVFTGSLIREFSWNIKV